MRKVHSIEVDVDGEKKMFYYRKPSYGVTMRVVDMMKNAEKDGKACNEEVNKQLFTACMTHEDGKSYSAAEIKSLLEDEDFEVVDALVKPLMPKGKDEEKNG
jgi:hypothetical protein